MNYEAHFRSELDRLRDEGNYRVFADLERHRGAFPQATRRAGGEAGPVTIWCSNDYLGMGQHPDVLARDARRAGPLRRRGRGHAQHFGYHPRSRAA